MIRSDAITLPERRSPTRPEPVVPEQLAGSETGAPSERRGHPLPAVSSPLLRLFTWYSARYLCRHFHALRVSTTGAPLPDLRMPVVFYSNHASWWDPLVALQLRQRFFPERTMFAPMDASALTRYAFFQRLGVFGVEPGTTRGAINFLRHARAILGQPDSALWLTPQARFADARELPARLKAGIGHLSRLAPEIGFVPVAIEYSFWEERLPEILVRFGPPRISQPDEPRDATAWTEIFSRHLTETQQALAAESIRRDRQAFQNLLAGRSGVGVVYDGWRALIARLKGKRFSAAHSNL